MNISVCPIAYESMGVRSMATCFKAEKSIVVDPSAALAPKRHGLPPHPREEKALTMAKNRIRKHALKADILAVTHFHFDHHDPEEIFYGKKKIYIKDPRKKVNMSQKKRGSDFLDRLPKSAHVEFADGKTFTHGDLKARFSPAFPHGPRGIRLGYVLMCQIMSGNDSVVFGSDTQGPVCRRAAKWIIEADPRILIMDGPPTYMLGYRFSRRNLEKAKRNLASIMEETGCKVILDHHLLRDANYMNHYGDFYELGDVYTAAEYAGKRNRLLEADRRRLWEDEAV